MLWIAVPVAGLTALGGCTSLIDPNVPEQIRQLHEPETGGAYLLYRPSTYNIESVWPLVVVCHSDSFDSANRQIKDWTLLAESNGFLVAAPSLEYDRGYSVWKGDESATMRSLNERRVLSTVRHVQAGHNISEDRILIYGYKRGADPALYTGLRHPGTFRAVSVVDPDVDPSAMPPGAGVDPPLPVHVRLDVTDRVRLPKALRRNDTAELVDWLRAAEVEVFVDRGSVKREDARLATDFFEMIIRKRPWLQVRAVTPDAEKPLALQFKARASFTPGRYFWRFPNGATSYEAQPVHTFPAAGRYAITLEVPSPVVAKTPGELVRTVQVTVPGGDVHP